MRHIIKIGFLALAFLGIALGIRHFGNQDLFIAFLGFWICVQILYMVVDRYIQQNKLLKLKQEALHAEVSLLKNQINPHFFFNTLNNLYAMARVKSEQTPALILKLSDLMRFTIYEGKKDHVALLDEVAYLENYLDLQAVRSRAKGLDLRFEKEIDDLNLQVPPLLFIIPVENAFKHGVATVSDGAFVHMKLRAQGKHLRFTISNNFGPSNQRRPGIGLENMKRRLALLFPRRHRYDTQQTGQVYTANLELDL